MNKNRSFVEDGKQYAKCRKGFANYFEYLVLGKLLIIRESFLSFIY
jgi:hypothetical protein